MLRPALVGIPGVAEVATLGGEREEVVVQTTDAELRAAGAAFSDVATALRARLGRAPRPTAPHDLEHDPVLARLTRVSVQPAMSGGAADVNGVWPIVVGIVIAKRGADPTAVIARVKQVIESHRKEMPQMARLGVLYDRSELAGRVEKTLVRAVAEEVAVVALVVLMFLLHWRSALVPMLTLPLVVLLTFAAMRLFGIPATVMSLGGIAIALGMAVDAELVALEACHRRLETDRSGWSPDVSAWRRRRLVAAAGAFAPAILTSLVIAALAFIPVFAFGGETGRLLRPLALTKTLVILLAAVVTLTVAPALRDRLLRGRIVPELGNPLTRALVRAYRPFVHFALRAPALTLVTAGLAALSCLPIVSRLGSEFLPRLDEGDLLYMPTTAPGLSHDDAPFELATQDRLIAKHPGVDAVYGKIGRAETATDPAPLSMAETTIRLKPRSEWPRVERHRWYSGWAPRPLERVLGLVWPESRPMTTAELIDSLDKHGARPGLDERLDGAGAGPHRHDGDRRADPGRASAWSPARRRGWTRWHRRCRPRWRACRGRAARSYEGLGGETRARFELDRGCARAPSTSIPRRRAPSPTWCCRAATWASWPSPETPDAGARPMRVRLSLSAPWLVEATAGSGPRRDGPRRPQRATGSRCRWRCSVAPCGRRCPRRCAPSAVSCPVTSTSTSPTGPTSTATSTRARRDVEAAVGPTLQAAAGERLEWTGQYKLLTAGQRRLQLIVPMVALLMLGLLFFQFRSLTEALHRAGVGPVRARRQLLDAVPARLPPVARPSGWGCCRWSAWRCRPGWSWSSTSTTRSSAACARASCAAATDIVAAHAEGTVQRLRPKLMTIVTMAAALMPLLWAQGAGSEIMKRVAAPMVGGLVTSAFLTLEVIPVLYTIWRTRQLAAGRGFGRRTSAAPATARDRGLGQRSGAGRVKLGLTVSDRVARKRWKSLTTSDLCTPFAFFAMRRQCS